MADRSVWTYVVTTDLEFFATVQPLWSSSLAAGAQPTPATRRRDAALRGLPHGASGSQSIRRLSL